MGIPKVLYFLFDVIFPEYCLGCKTRGTLLCRKCLLKADLARAQVENEHIFSVFSYHDPVIKNAIWQLKYNNKKNMAPILGLALYEHFLEDLSDLKEFSPGKPILIIPVPLSKRRLKERGYNQSSLLAKALVENIEKSSFEINENIIYRIKETLPQAKIMNRQKRLENVHGAFALNPYLSENFLRGRTFMILDDVSTTGGTINEIRKLLRKSGAKKAVGFAVAH